MVWNAASRTIVDEEEAVLQQVAQRQRQKIGDKDKYRQGIQCNTYSSVLYIT